MGKTHNSAHTTSEYSDTGFLFFRKLTFVIRILDFGFRHSPHPAWDRQRRVRSADLDEKNGCVRRHRQHGAALLGRRLAFLGMIGS